MIERMLDASSSEAFLMVAIAYLFGALFMCVGAVTSLRWLVARELQLRSFVMRPRRKAKLHATWAAAPRTTSVVTSRPEPRSSPGEPLRLEPGPRDW